MVKKERSKFEYIGYIFVIIGFCIIVIDLIYNHILNYMVNNEINEYIVSSTNINVINTNESEKSQGKSDKVIVDEKETFLVLEIPSIKLKKNIYNFDSKYNDVKYNVEILDASSTPDILNGNVILASHNGNSKVSYFNQLYKIDIDDEIIIYYDGYKYIYKLDKIYDIDKNGIAQIYRDKHRSTITLITCKKKVKDKQEVYIGYLSNVYEY